MKSAKSKGKAKVIKPSISKPTVQHKPHKNRRVKLPQVPKREITVVRNMLLRAISKKRRFWPSATLILTWEGLWWWHLARRTIDWLNLRFSLIWSQKEYTSNALSSTHSILAKQWIFSRISQESGKEMPIRCISWKNWSQFWSSIIWKAKICRNNLRNKEANLTTKWIIWGGRSKEFTYNWETSWRTTFILVKITLKLSCSNGKSGKWVFNW